jgi:hypothetical protein
MKNEKDVYQIFFTVPENVKIKILYKSILIQKVIKYLLTRRLFTPALQWLNARLIIPSRQWLNS